MVRPKSAPKPGAKQNIQAILGKRRKSPEPKSSNPRPNGDLHLQDQELRSSKRARRTNMPYQAPESITSILKPFSRLEEAEKELARSTAKAAKPTRTAPPISLKKRSKTISSTATRKSVTSPPKQSPSIKAPKQKIVKEIDTNSLPKALKPKSKNPLKSLASIPEKLLKKSRGTSKLKSKLKNGTSKLASQDTPIISKKSKNVNKTKRNSTAAVLPDSKNAGKSTKARKSKKDALNPKPQVTKYEIDPTFLFNLPIPPISTLANSRLLIRAVLLNDMNLLKQLVTKDPSQIASPGVPRSPHIDRDALSYAIQLENKEAIKILLHVDEKAAEKFGSYPELMLEAESTGHGSRIMFGHGLKGVTVGRGGKEGNAAFLIDRSSYSGSKVPMHYDSSVHILNAMKTGVSINTIEYYISLKKDSYANQTLLSNIFQAVRYGRHDVAGKLVNMATKRGGHGFNQLHEEALVLDKNKPFSPFKSVSVIKKCTDNARITPLHCAAINPNPFYLQTLLNSVQEYNLMDTGNWTLIHYAAVCTKDGPLKLLLRKGIPTIVVEKEGNTPLHLAASRGRLENVRALLEHEQSNVDEVEGPLGVSSMTKFNKFGMTPLHLAAQEGYGDILKVLLAAGADGNKFAPAQFEKVTPFMVACRSGHLAIVKLLVDHGVKRELGDRRGRTAVAYAVINGHADIVSYLIRLGVNHESKDSSGNSLVHYAAAYGWFFNTKLLLEAGCDPNQGNLWKLTPLALAFMKGHTGIVEMLVKLPGVDIDTSIDDSNGMSLLLKTCESSKLTKNLIQRLTFLIDLHKADCTKVDFEGNNGLHQLVKHRLSENHKEYVEMLKYLLTALKLLIDRGCDPGGLNAKMQSPFFLATQVGNFKIAEKLIEYGHKLKADAAEDGNNFLHELVKHGTSEQVPLLYEKLVKDSESLSAMKLMANTYNKKGFTPLLHLLKSFQSTNAPQDIKLLIRLTMFLVKTLEADVNAVTKSEDGESDSVLHLAVSTSFADDIMPMLLAKKPNFDPINKDSLTPLAVAVLKGHTNAARVLINAGADVNFKIKSHLSAGLLLVLGKSQPNLFLLIPFFVSKGADVNEVTSDTNNSILHYVSQHPDQVHALEAVQSIIKAGASVNRQNSDGRTPLHLAADSRGNETDATYDIEDALISLGGDVTIKDKLGRTPLHYAFVKIGQPLATSFFDPIELVMLLVNAMKTAYGAEAFKEEATRDIYGATPLHYAAKRGSTICCSYLISELGGNFDALDNIGNTPFGLAVLSGHEGCSLYFQQQGGDFSKILDTSSKIPSKDTTKQSWTWNHLKLKAADADKRTAQDSRYPIFQEVVNKNWQGILHLMLGSLKTAGTGVSVGIAAAVKTQRLKLASKLIHWVKHSREITQKHETLLHTLAKHSKPAEQDHSNLQVQIANSLLKKGVSPLELDDSRANAFIYAAILLNYPLMMELAYALDNSNYLNVVSRLPPDSFGRTAFTALFWDVGESTEMGEGIKAWASSLLSHGATANTISQYPLDLSRYPGVRCLVKTDKEIRNHQKYSPLIAMVIHGNYHMVKWLMGLGSKVSLNFGDEEGRTPLMHAVRINDVKMVKLLLGPPSYDYKKDTSAWRVNYSSWVRGKGNLSDLQLDKRDKKGWTAADHLVAPALEKKSYVYKNVEPILTILCKAGVSFIAKSGDNLSPLERAIFYKRQHIVNIMYKIMKTPVHQQIVLQMEYEGFSKIENELGLPPRVTTFAQDAQKSVEVKEKEAEGTRSQIVEPNPLLGLDKDNSKVLIDHEQTIPYDCVLTKVDISYGMYGLYNFYKMQVVHEPRGKELVFLFTQWGRVGEAGQHQKTPFPTQEEAAKEFKKIFKAKSGNGWDQFNSFTPFPKKYRLVNKDLRNAAKAHELSVKFEDLLSAAKAHRSVLEPQVYEAIKKISLAHRLGDSTHQRYSSNRTWCKKSDSLPIVTTEALKKGEEILQEIGKAIHKKDVLASGPQEDNSEDVRTELFEKMVALSEEFYALVPVYGFETEKLQPVFDWRALRQRQEDIHNLINLGFGKELLMAAECNSPLVNPFEYIYRCLGTKMKLLNMSKEIEEEEAEMILQYVHNTSDQEVKVRGIFRIQRPDEPELSLDNRWLLWHGTKAENLLSILHNGLQVAPLGADLSGHLFGKGIYLADMFAKSEKYCHKTGGCTSNFMLLCEVALGKVHEVTLAMAAEQAEKSGRFLPTGFDSLKTSDCLYEPDPRVSVIWKGVTVPLGPKVEIEYKEDESWGLDHNEFIVFNQNQVKLRYLIQFDD